MKPLVVGLALGTALTWMGFTDWAQVHQMFTFADLRLFFTFLGGVAFTGVGETWVRTETLGGQLTSGPGVASWGPGRLDVFARGSDNSLIHKWYSNGWWNLVLG